MLTGHNEWKEIGIIAKNLRVLCDETRLTEHGYDQVDAICGVFPLKGANMTAETVIKAHGELANHIQELQHDYTRMSVEGKKAMDKITEANPTAFGGDALKVEQSLGLTR
jgi:hypothetical protein